jgi:hypothetical protein
MQTLIKPLNGNIAISQFQLMEFDVDAVRALISEHAYRERVLSYVRPFPQPDHDERQTRERRQRPVELDQRVCNAARNARGPHRDTDRHCGDHGKTERRQHPQHTDFHMLCERRAALRVAGNRADERVEGRARRRQEQRLDPAEPRREPP